MLAEKQHNLSFQRLSPPIGLIDPVTIVVGGSTVIFLVLGSKCGSFAGHALNTIAGFRKRKRESGLLPSLFQIRLKKRDSRGLNQKLSHRHRQPTEDQNR